MAGYRDGETTAVNLARGLRDCGRRPGDFRFRRWAIAGSRSGAGGIDADGVAIKPGERSGIALRRLCIVPGAVLKMVNGGDALPQGSGEPWERTEIPEDRNGATTWACEGILGRRYPQIPG
jgi:hypothetical protein